MNSNAAGEGPALSEGLGLAPERAAFEAWLNPGRHEGNVSPWVEPGRYEKETHQLAWLAWRAARAWVPMSERKPQGGQLIVKRWRHGAVWAGTHNEGPKNESFDEWKAL
jgi:hypothetical protein